MIEVSTTPFTDTKIIDNINRKVVDVIKDQLKKCKEAKFAIGYFFLSGFLLVKDDFPSSYHKIPFLKIVMGNETTYPTKEELVEGYNLRESLKLKMIEELQSIVLTDEQRERLITLRNLIANNVIEVKLFDKARLHAKLYLFITNPDEVYGSKGLAIVGSSNFTAEGLTKNKELNVLLTDKSDVDYLEQWFNELWSEAIDFNADLIKVIDVSGSTKRKREYPLIGKYMDKERLFRYFVYKWFEGRVLDVLRGDILAEFQTVGVLNAINIINHYNGVILADSVGLGKSYMASAIIEDFINKRYPNWLYNDKEPSVLLILPPSLIPQWEELLIHSKIFFPNYNRRCLYDKGNEKLYELYKDDKYRGRLHFLSLGLFQNYNDLQLKELADEYELIVIDEAHKYRNKNTNRFKNVRRLQKKSNDANFANKFILLTATPLNNSINDIKNLISLFMDDTFTQFNIKGVNITELVRDYNRLKKRLRDTDDKNLRQELQKKASEIKEKVLDEIMVLRTRKYIAEQFKDIKINNKPLIFKDPQPYSLEYSRFHNKNYDELIKLVSKSLDELTFEYTKLYGTRFVVFEEDEEEEDEENKHYIEIAELLKLLLGKRLESGIYPFEATLQRIRAKAEIFYKIFNSNLDKIINDKKLEELVKEAIEKAKIDKELEEVYEYDLETENVDWFDRLKNILLEYAEEELGEIVNYNSIEILRVGLKRLLKRLKHDIEIMHKILLKLDELKDRDDLGFIKLGKITDKDEVIEVDIYKYKRDPKLEALKNMLYYPNQKLEDLPSLYGKKIIVFTQYKDTAYYLYHNLKEWFEKESILHRWIKDHKRNDIKMRLVTGDTDIDTKVSYIKRFAPDANNGYDDVEKYGDIQILVSTDVFSEGVNLQDADAVINYDLPWNPMVIVQRVGRVNRIGNDKDITVINSIPSNEIEVVVRVLNKLKEKIHDLTLIVGKDVKILSPEEEIRIETFGEKIKDLSKASITALEEYGLSDDFKEFIPKGIPKEQMDEYLLLNKIQYELKYKPDDFDDVKDLDDTYYTFIDGNDRLISIYEFYRGKYPIMKKIVSIKDDNINYETPLVFLDLINSSKKSASNIDNIINCLKKIDDENKKVIEELKGQNPTQSGFIYNLFNALLVKREEARSSSIFDRYRSVVLILQLLPHHTYSRELKELLLKMNLISINNNNVIVNNLVDTVNTLYDYLVKEKGITSIDSLKPNVKHWGWYYEF